MTFDSMSFILGTFSGLFIGFFFVYFAVKWSYDASIDSTNRMYRKTYVRVRTTRL